jgi:PilZ domain
MSGRERRRSPRKDCAVLLNFRVVANGASSHLDDTYQASEPGVLKGSIYSANMQGKALNLSERGMYFSSHEKLSVGNRLEIYMTLPRELTGRGQEQVRCSARVVHVEDRADLRGAQGIGAVVERFEPVIIARNWAN